MTPFIHPVAFTYALCVAHPTERHDTPGVFEVVAEKFKAWVVRQKTQRALEGMSDRMLGDIGVMHHDIPRRDSQPRLHGVLTHRA